MDDAANDAIPTAAAFSTMLAELLTWYGRMLEGDKAAVQEFEARRMRLIKGYETAVEPRPLLSHSRLRQLITDERARLRDRGRELDVADVLGIVDAWLAGQ